MEQISKTRQHSARELEARTDPMNADALKLAELGYVQEMKRNFSVWSVLGVAFSLTNSWFGISSSLVTGINSGGPMLLIYGIIIVAIITTCIAISLSELSSAMPSAGGQYFWANELASPRYARQSSYLTGWFAWAGSIFTTASVALALGAALVGCWVLSHPDTVIEAWMVFVAYQAINLFTFFFNCYGKTLPYISTTTLYISLVSFAIIIITIPAVAPAHQPAEFVFATFINNTGWKSSGIAFIVGLVNPNWSFSCLDCATHMAEEVPRPEKMIPIAIMGTVLMGFVTAWFYVIAMFFSINGDFQDIAGSLTGVPILQLFYSALTGRVGQTAGAIVLESLIICTGMGCLIASQTWQSRLCWSFARDRGLPFSTFLQKVDKKLDVPFRAHLVSSIIVAIVGCLYLASYTAFNSMVTACIVLLYVSYAVPVICLLIKGRNNIQHGPFWLGPVGLASNIVLLLWTIFTLIMYSFPYTMPVAASNMNYVSAVYGVVILIIGVDWYVRGREQYRGQEIRQAAAEEIIRRGSAFDKTLSGGSDTDSHGESDQGAKRCHEVSP